MNWKKITPLLTALFAVSLVSSAATRFFLAPKQVKQVPWEKLLKLTPEQSKKFSQLESDLNSALKEVDLEEAQNKIFLCSYLDSEDKSSDQMKRTAAKMAETYLKKQERVVAALASLSETLTPEQRKIFSQTLKHEVCVSCRNSTGKEKCLCGMCEH